MSFSLYSLPELVQAMELKHCIIAVVTFWPYIVLQFTCVTQSVHISSGFQMSPKKIKEECEVWGRSWPLWTFSPFPLILKCLSQELMHSTLQSWRGEHCSETKGVSFKMSVAHSDILPVSFSSKKCGLMILSLCISACTLTWVICICIFVSSMGFHLTSNESYIHMASRMKNCLVTEYHTSYEVSWIQESFAKLHLANTVVAR
jgi:hypothetical protein